MDAVIKPLRNQRLPERHFGLLPYKLAPPAPGLRLAKSLPDKCESDGREGGNLGSAGMDRKLK